MLTAYHEHFLFVSIFNAVPNRSYRVISLKTVAVYHGLNNEFKVVGSIHWPERGELGPPPDRPKCGFDGALCDNSK